MDRVEITTDVEGMITEIRTSVAGWRPTLPARALGRIVAVILYLIGVTLAVTDRGLAWCDRTQARADGWTARHRA